MVCPACKGLVHSSQPSNCPGGTFCDCHHRIPIEIKKMNEESTTSSKLIETGETKNV